MGKDPGKHRLQAVSQAIDVLLSATSHATSIDRQLALALWEIGYHGYFQSLSWQEHEGAWRNGDFNDQILDIGSRIEDWLGQRSTEVA